MSDCMHIPECEFFHNKLETVPMTAEFMKMEYCYKSPESCARVCGTKGRLERLQSV